MLGHWELMLVDLSVSRNFVIRTRSGQQKGSNVEFVLWAQLLDVSRHLASLCACHLLFLLTLSQTLCGRNNFLGTDFSSLTRPFLPKVPQ